VADRTLKQHASERRELPAIGWRSGCVWGTRCGMSTGCCWLAVSAEGV